MDVEVVEFDGEGLISADLARLLDPDAYREHDHHSFQIRLPYIKGVVHEVDFRALFKELGVTEIADIEGVRHPVSKVDMILTKSMCKGWGRSISSAAGSISISCMCQIWIAAVGMG